jgi:hypothetical protein
MSLQAGQASLNKASKMLFARWGETRSLWRDEVAQEFEDRYITPLMRDLRVSQEAMDHMAAVLTKVRHDCE